MTGAISRFPVPALSELPADIRANLQEMQDRAGFVPNGPRTYTHRPDEYRVFTAYRDTLMLRASGLSKAEKEMIIVVTSAANGCTYSVVAHGAMLRVYERNPRIADQLATNYLKAEITPRQKAMLDFAMKVCGAAHTVGDDDFARLREHGWNDEDAWDIAAITALYGMANRMASVTAMRANDEFYLMGRVPRAPKA